MYSRLLILYYKFTERTQILRISSLLIFSAISIWTGIKFHAFIKSIGTENFYPRPPAVDAFLPISSLMNIKYFFIFGDLHKAHPAGVFILLSAIFVSFIFSKSFCGWVCPFGFLGEILLSLRKVIFGRDFLIPKWLDYPLRAIKYILLFFFVYAIFFSMDGNAIKSFLDSDYNKISDIKMYYFFASITQMAFWIIAIIFLFSFFFNFFWCRYLCPYGALMAIVGFLSPFRIRRNVRACVSCSACAKACPHHIKTDKVKTVFSDDCSSCMLCVSARCDKDAIGISPIFSFKKISGIYVFATVLLVFLFFRLVSARLNLWQNNISQTQYITLIEKADSLAHP